MNDKKFKGIIFDLDGTLLNTLKDIADSMNYVLKKHKKATHQVEEYRNFIGDGVVTLVKRAASLKDNEESLINKMSEEFKKMYSKCWNKNTVPYDGIEDLLTELTSEKIFMAVFSNKPDVITKKSVKYFFPNFHFISVLGEGIFPRKPDPSGALYIVNLMGIKSEECLYVGDSKTDMETANASGMKKVGVLWGFRDEKELKEGGANWIVNRPSEILKIVKGEC